MKLNYKRLGEGEPLIILHGLLGMLDNWVSLANEYAAYFDVVVVDARNHGRSPWNEEHTYAAMVEDLNELIADLGFDEVNLLGHSMGGKTVMKFAQNYPEKVAKLIVADIGVRAYKIHHDQIMKGLNSVPLVDLNRRTDANDYLAKYISEESVRAFLMKSLYRTPEKTFAWRFNVEVLEKALPDISVKIDDSTYTERTLFLRGANSNYINDEDWEEITTYFPLAELETIENAGHWLHAEQRETFLEKSLAFLVR